MAEPSQHKFAIVLFAGVVSDTRLMASDDEGSRVVERYLQVVLDLVHQHHSRAQLHGDGVLAEFNTAVSALLCALDIQRDIQAETDSVPPEHRVHFCVGINVGDVTAVRNAFLEREWLSGDAVDLATRLAALADPGGICISEAAFAAVSEEPNSRLESIGDLSFEAIAEPIPAYKVVVRDLDERVAATASEVASNRYHKDEVAQNADVAEQVANLQFTTELPETLQAQLVTRALSMPQAVAPPPAAPEPAFGSRQPVLEEAVSKPKSGLAMLTRYALIAGGLALCVWLGIKLVPIIFGATASSKSRKSDEGSEETHPVDCSVFSPPKLALGDQILVQVFLHPPSDAEQAETYAKRFDTDAEWRGFTSLSLDLASGTRVAVQLDIDDLVVSDEGAAEVRWQNDVVGVSLLVSAPDDLKPGKRHGTARFLVEGVPAGRIHFVIELEASLEDEAAPEGLGDSSHRYNKAFISYASEDRAEVLKRVQTLGALKIDYFQDVLELEPGDRWERELYTEIDRCDLFLLFWSSASRASEWVRKETQYALDRQTESDTGEPELIPMMIEGPPPPKPWPECAHLHFNDKLIYLMRYAD